MMTFLKTKRVQEMIGLAVVLGATATIVVEVGKMLGKKKEEQ